MAAGGRLQRVFARLWLGVLLVLAALEFTALLRKGDGDTLSEYARVKTAAPVMRGALGGLLGWLVYHWLFASGGPLGWLDAVCTLAGVVLGAASLRVRRAS